MPEKLLYAIAVFDKSTLEKMEEIGQLLIQAGFTGKQTLNIPHHITLGSFNPSRKDEMKQRLQGICSDFKSFNLRFSHIGLFGLDVVFFAPDVNHDLLSLRQCVNDDNTDQNWTAHTTIFIDAPEKVLKALPLITANFKFLETRVESICLYEFWPTRFIAKYNLQ
jgi:2'-5' RNA ligase